MFKNKHFILALLIAPILSIIAYVGTDLAVSEKPQSAQEGDSYKLASQSNCRYTSGLCNMENGDFKLKFRSESVSEDKLVLSLYSQYPLENAQLSLVSDQQSAGEPVAMQPSDDGHQNWQLTLPAPNADSDWLRVVVKANNTLYYGETQTKFVHYQTLLNQ